MIASEDAVAPYFAHTKEDAPPNEWQRLADHLAGVAELAARFAADMGAEAWGHSAGLWHDLGKFSAAYQEYLRSAAEADAHLAETAGRIDHSTAGAQHAVASVDVLGHLLAYVIAGHHSGLLDGRAAGSCQQARLSKEIEP